MQRCKQILLVVCMKIGVKHFTCTHKQNIIFCFIHVADIYFIGKQNTVNEESIWSILETVKKMSELFIYTRKQHHRLSGKRQKPFDIPLDWVEKVDILAESCLFSWYNLFSKYKLPFDISLVFNASYRNFHLEYYFSGWKVYNITLWEMNFRDSSTLLLGILTTNITINPRPLVYKLLLKKIVLRNFQKIISRKLLKSEGTKLSRSFELCKRKIIWPNTLDIL